MLPWLLLVFIVLWVLWKDRELRNYWRRKGVNAEVACPLYRPLAFLRSLSPGLPEVNRLYHSTTEPFLGFFKGRRPVLMVRDPCLAHNVLNADFHHFADKRHPIQLDTSEDPLSQHLIGLTGDKWKTVRSKLTPVFSSGKIKESLPLIEEAVDDYIPQLGSEAVDVYPLSVTFVTDVILSYAFGLSRNDPNRSEVRKMGFKAIEVTNWITLKRAIRFCFPKLFGLLGMRAFDPEVTSFFTNFVKHAIFMIKSTKGVGRVDFISRMENIATIAPEGERNGLIAAQVFSFYVAGFETTCFTLSTCLYELSKNKTVFSQVRKELDNLLSEYGRFNYESLQEAYYLTQIIQESMRLYPADYATPRICTKSYQIPGTDIILEKGTEILIPGFCLSRDADNYDRPTEFDPERFSKEKKIYIKPGTYFPFGDGPRKCIAIRFSMLELKFIIARLISSFDMELDQSSPKNLTFNKQSRVTHYNEKIMVRFKKRTDIPIIPI